MRPRRWQLPVVAALLAVAGCAAPGGTAPPAAPVTSVERREVPPELRVPDPKDARGIPVCELLTDEQQIGLGLDPQAAVPDIGEYADSCTIRYADRSTSAILTLATKPLSQNLADLYLLRDTYARFEPTEVAGHPAFRGDGVEEAICTLYVAIADDQGMSVEARVSGPPPPDPCAPSRRMAELILSNLPPLN